LFGAFRGSCIDSLECFSVRVLGPNKRIVLAIEISRVLSHRGRSRRVDFLSGEEAELGGLTGEARERRKAELQAKPEGLAKALLHDFRRTAVRNMLNTGTDESTAMKITGHRTASVFKRYRIVNLADMQRAVARLAQSGNGSDQPQGRRALPSGKVSDQD